MAGIRFKFDTNAPEVARALRERADSFLDAVPRYVHRELATLLPDLRRRVPRESGELADSALVRLQGQSIVVGFAAFYAPYVYYRQPRFRARTVRSTLKRFARSAKFRAAVRRGVEKCARDVLGAS